MDTAVADLGTDNISSEIKDEIDALNAIYEPDTLSVHDAGTHAPSTGPSTILALKLPVTPLTLAVSLPYGYPVSAPPQVLSPCISVGNALPKGAGNQAVETAQRILSDVWSQDVCLYEFVEELERTIQNDVTFRHLDSSSAIKEDTTTNPGAASETGPPASAAEPVPQLTWTIDDPVTVHKSVFQARACPVASPAAARAAVVALRGTDGKLVRATHHIWAYRLRNAAAPGDGPGALRCDCDDDGEKAAGAKVLGVLEAMGAEGVLVVVSRWYGGVLLGPERFRIIARCARGVVLKGGWGRESAS